MPDYFYGLHWVRKASFTCRTQYCNKTFTAFLMTAILLAYVDCCLGFFTISVKLFGIDMVSLRETLKQRKNHIKVKCI